MKKKAAPMLQPEWSYMLETEKVADKPLAFVVEASAEECRDLARRLDVVAISDLRADVGIEREKSGLIYVSGIVRANLEQSCVITGDPVITPIEEEFDGWFSDKDSPVSLNKVRHDRLAQKADMEVQVLDEKDDPEPVINGKIDIGELAAQYLSLAIPPYPHKEGAMHDVTTDDVPLNKKATRPNPFAALKDWKKGPENEEG